jgi:hypothetical protein
LKPQNLSRIVCCQGTIQLAVAIHTLLYRQRKGFPDNQPKFKNFLVVYDLFTAENQEKVFFAAIKRMAQAVLDWEAIIYLDSATINHLDELLIKKGKHTFDVAMEKILGIRDADEIYASRNWQKGSRMMLNMFSGAYKICYGDSIGLYFPESYFSNKDLKTRFRLSRLGQWMTLYKNKIQAIVKYPKRRPLFKSLEAHNFDYGYFTFPTIASEYPNFKYEVLPIEDLKGTFEKFIEHVSLDPPKGLDLTGGLSVLLTSNFSEAERMSLEDELTCYIQFVRAHQKDKGALLIKPHPRDSKEKIELLKKRFTNESYTVFVLDGPMHFYIPFEFFLIKFERISPGILPKIKFFTVSSSCLSFWFLFHVRPYVGLGEQLVKKYFQTNQVKGRIEHEEDLRKVMEATS